MALTKVSLTWLLTTSSHEMRNLAGTLCCGSAFEPWTDPSSETRSCAGELPALKRRTDEDPN